MVVYNYRPNSYTVYLHKCKGMCLWYFLLSWMSPPVYSWALSVPQPCGEFTVKHTCICSAFTGMTSRNLVSCIHYWLLMCLFLPKPIFLKPVYPLVCFNTKTKVVVTKEKQNKTNHPKPKPSKQRDVSRTCWNNSQ